MKNLAKSIRSDFSASIVVFLVAIPLCLGIAMGSGAPMFAGLIAGVVGGIVVGSLSGSQLSVSGPAAGLTVVVASGIGKLPAFEAFLLAVVLSGLFQVILGFLKAGIIGDYIPSSVISGMLASIGLILILKQIPHLFGYHVDYQGNETFLEKNQENTFTSVIDALRQPVPMAIILGSISLFIQIVWDQLLVKKSKLFKLIPAPLVVVVIAVGINYMLIQQQHPMALTGDFLVNIPTADSLAGLTSFLTFPEIRFISLPAVWITALTIAIVASLETLLNVEAADELDRYKRVTPKNRELFAQGVGNMVSGLIGGLPVTSVVVRTSANVNAGAKTKMSTVFHGLLLALSIMFIPGLLNLIPLSALAAVLIYTGFKLARPAVFIKYYKKGMDQFLPFLITIVAIILTDLLSGIMVGILAGLFFVLRSNFKTSIFIVNDENKYLFRLRKDVSFLNKPILKNKLEEVPENASVLIDAGRADFIDKDILEVINDFSRHAHLKNIHVEFKGMNKKPLHALLNKELKKDVLVEESA